MRIAITGASGNIGSAVLRRFTADGEHQLIGIARRIPEIEPNGGRVEWVSADLTKDRSVAVLGRAFAGADAVVHLAWGFQPSHDLTYLEELGVGGTGRVLSAVAAAGVPHVVHMSSVGAYSAKRDDTPVDESWPTDGIPSSRYSLHKAAAERLLDRHEQEGHGTLISRMRPGIVGQRSAGSALLRYGLPAIVPAALLDHIPALPLDRRPAVPMVHADDVADAIARVVERRTGGAFNLAADPPITTRRIADALGARPIHVPSSVVRPLFSAAWHLRLQPVDTGWLDMAFALPLLDSSRASRELGWSPRVDATSVLEEVLAGMRHRDADATPVLRRRSVAGAMRDFVTRGPVDQRNRP
ncbi:MULTISPECIES: NAD-dependent epimerase/dehydratase family protein [Nocardioides]|uniref:NAD-dependent epimerase/dehydratase family protein n=1 Tax=Nocardioides vastitatis TaxID=2568655 RepID=A0ABW0ZMX5_9ACTN|nr:NAD-dependent epimerase/dehydratase family protein [Nocardioides sp.]THI98585.1 NAD-dependent epimerase/dehydratase family protein [Nocardioides sp.]